MEAVHRLRSLQSQMDHIMSQLMSGDGDDDLDQM